jgi:hypothetical protein
LDGLQALGVGGQAMVAAVLLAGALYAYKGAGLAKFAAMQAASGLWYVVVLGVALAVAILAGWIDPNPDAVLAFLSDVVSWLGEQLGGVELPAVSG